jgi:RNA polymerase sigma-70 factor (ECF subfamily)
LGAEHTQPLIEELATRQRSRLARFLRSRVRNAADVPDLIQEVFLRLLRVPNRETIWLPEAYIFTIARHVAYQHRLGSARAESFVAIDAALSDLLPGSEPDPVLEVSAQECVGILEETLQQMTPKVRATFLLYRRDGLSMEQISARLGITRPTAKKYLVMALAQFRSRLKELE